MRQSYFKNAALLTGSDVVLRLAGMGLRIWLANALGGAGMGLYQLVLAVYGLFVTLATAGISVAAARLLTEELSRDKAAARGMLVRLVLAGLTLGGLAMAAQFATAGLAAKWWLGDIRAAAALRTSALGLPWMAVSAVLRGFFLARRRVEPNVLSQLAEQTVRIAAVVWALSRTQGWPDGSRCALVLAATALSEAISTALMALFYRREAARCFGSTAPRPPREVSRRLWDILWPVEGGRALSSALHTAENMLVPACLAVYLAASGGRTAALEQYGTLKGMALPLLNFPFGLLGSLAVLLMPEITQAHIEGQTARLNALLDRMLRLTGYFSMLAGTLFWVWGRPLAQLLYHSPEAGFYLETLAPAMPLMYLESMVDGAMKGIGEQKAAFRYSVWDAVLRIGGVAVLLPRYGMRGFLTVILLSSFYTCAANTGRLLLSSGTGHAFRRWLGAPLLAAVAAGAAGRGVRRALTGFPAQGLPGQLAVLTVGGTVTAIVFLLAALPLGLWEEQKAAFRYSVWDAVLRIGGVAVLLPRYGMRGFLTVILLSSFYTCAANTGRLLLSSGTGHAFRRWLGAPLLAAVAAGAAGRGVRRALTGFPAQGLPGQLAVLTVGGTVTAIVFLLAALPLGLWEELRAVLRQAKTGKNRGK